MHTLNDSAFLRRTYVGVSDVCSIVLRRIYASRVSINKINVLLRAQDIGSKSAENQLDINKAIFYDRHQARHV